MTQPASTNDLLQAMYGELAALNDRPGGLLAYLPTGLADRVMDFFVYEADFVGGTVLNAGTTVSVPIAIQADSHFLITQVAATIADAATQSTFTNPAPITWLATDSGSGRQLSSSAIPLANIAGTAQLPMLLTVPKLLKATSTLSTQLTHLNGAGTNYVVRLSYLGVKIFGMPRNPAAS